MTTGELAYPVGHPAHPDYKGEPYHNPAAVYDQDFPVGHPARGGANVREIDTPDGQRAAHLKHVQDLQQLALMGSLPPLKDPDTGETIELTPAQLAHVYAVRNGLLSPAAAEVTQLYRLNAQAAEPAAPAVPQPTAQDIAISYLLHLGYTPERAGEIIAKYGVPEVAKDREIAAHQ